MGIKHLFKKVIRKVIKTISLFLRSQYLNSYELKGKIGIATYLKFILIPKVKVPFELGRSIRGTNFLEKQRNDQFHFFVKQLISGVSLDVLASSLFDTLQIEKKQSAAEIMDCNNNKKLKVYPAWAHVLPWDDMDIEEKYNTYFDFFIKNRSLHGLNFSNKSTKYKNEIMYSKDLAYSHINQTSKLLKSLKDNGYKTGKNPPNFEILIKDDSWRWYMSSEGNHRAYLCHNLGYLFFEGYINRIVNIKDYKSWKNVKNGTYTKEEAINIFNKIFQGSYSIRGTV